MVPSALNMFAPAPPDAVKMRPPSWATTRRGAFGEAFSTDWNSVEPASTRAAVSAPGAPGAGQARSERSSLPYQNGSALPGTSDHALSRHWRVVGAAFVSPLRGNSTRGRRCDRVPATWELRILVMAARS